MIIIILAVTLVKSILTEDFGVNFLNIKETCLQPAGTNVPLCLGNLI